MSHSPSGTRGWLFGDGSRGAESFGSLPGGRSSGKLTDQAGARLSTAGLQYYAAAGAAEATGDVWPASKTS